MLNRAIVFSALITLPLCAQGDSARVEVFNGSGAFMTQFGTFGTGRGQFLGPSGIAVTPTGNTLVADTILSRIDVFDYLGNFLYSFGTVAACNAPVDEPIAPRKPELRNPALLPTPCANPRQLQLPIGVAVLPGTSGRLTDFSILVTDQKNCAGRVAVFDSFGNYLFQFGNNPALDPHLLIPLQTPTGITVGPNGVIFVADTLNFRVVAFDRTGRFLFQFGTLPGCSTPRAVSNARKQLAAGKQSGKRRIPASEVDCDVPQQLVFPFSIVVQPNRPANPNSFSILVGDLGRVAVFNNFGAYAFQFGLYDFSLFPTGIAITPANTIAVVDNDDYEVDMFDSTGHPMFDFGSLGTGRGQFSSPMGVAIGVGGTMLVTDFGIDFDVLGFIFSASDCRIGPTD